ncbi:MAG: type II toxin-antitoxin system RelE/ParE family toxin [Candidatus Ornithospirochaeta sp.]
MRRKALKSRCRIQDILKMVFFEVRVIVGKDSSRVLYFFLEEKRIVFTNGFKKKTQKAPKREIETAIRYRADYIKRVKK